MGGDVQLATQSKAKSPWRERSFFGTKESGLRKDWFGTTHFRPALLCNIFSHSESGRNVNLVRFGVRSMLCKSIEANQGSFVDAAVSTRMFFVGMGDSQLC